LYADKSNSVADILKTLTISKTPLVRYAKAEKRRWKWRAGLSRGRVDFAPLRPERGRESFWQRAAAKHRDVMTHEAGLSEDGQGSVPESEGYRTRPLILPSGVIQ